MYNKVGGSRGMNLNFQNLGNAIFGLLALMFALLQMLSLLNLKALFLVIPPSHHIFGAGPPFEAMFFDMGLPLKSHQHPPTS